MLSLRGYDMVNPGRYIMVYPERCNIALPTATYRTASNLWLLLRRGLRVDDKVAGRTKGWYIGGNMSPGEAPEQPNPVQHPKLLKKDILRNRLGPQRAILVYPLVEGSTVL